MTLALQAVAQPSDELVETVGRSIGEHAAWIKRFPSAYSSANNHRVAELAALLILDANWSGILSPIEQIALERELAQVSQLLFSSDGIGLEQSPTYAAFSMEFLALVLHCRRWQDEASRLLILNVASESSAALTNLTHSDGSLIRYGDDDEGKIITVAVPELEYAKAIVKLAIGEVGERHHGLITFADGGISLLRFFDSEFETTWLFDHGPLGFGELAAHGHADVLSVSLRSAGVDWIVDAGTYKYHGDKAWRTYFRSSRAHNAPQLDGLDSSVMTGDFNWHPRKRAEGRLIASRLDGERAAVRATHTGYANLGMGAVFRTLERVEEGKYQVTDVSDSDHDMSTAFMFHPDCSVRVTKDGCVVTRPDSTLRIELEVSGHSDLNLETPQDRTAWFSPAFGTKIPTWRVGAKSAGKLSGSQQLIFNFNFSNHPALEAS